MIEEHLSKQADSKAEIAETVRLDGEYHLLLCEFGGNPEMSKIISQVLDKQYRAIANALTQNTYRKSHSLEEHRAIAQAVREGRGHLASELMVTHLERGKKLFT